MKRTMMLLCTVMALGLTACGGQKDSQPVATEVPATENSSKTVTGVGKGFGGDVKVTLTLEGDLINQCDIEGDQETPTIGQAAFEELGAQVVEANGFAIDGVSGATVTSEAVKTAVAEALGQEYVKETEAAAPVETAAPAQKVDIEGGLQLGMTYWAAHGTKCFTQAFVVVQEDKIVKAYLDEFQFAASDADVTALPNSDSDFGTGYAEGKTLFSKRENAEYYSAMMAEKGGSTVALDANFQAIENFVVGKTIEEVEALSGDSATVDAVSGATLVDTAGYLKAIAQAAKNAKDTQAVEYDGDSDSLKLQVAYGVANGTNAVTVGATVTDGDKIVLSYLDELQFMEDDGNVKGVPNSDSDFAESYAQGQVLYSKRENTEAYSKQMAEYGGSTVSIDENFDAIQNHVNGMTIDEAAALAGNTDAVDAVSGATLASTAGYVGVIVEAAQK